MKKVFALMIVFLNLVVIGHTQTLLQHVKELQRKKHAGEISESEYNELLSVILKGSNSGDTTNATPVGRMNSIRTSAQTWPLQLNLVITKYWRAKDLVNLNTELDVLCNGRSMPGKVILTNSDRIVVAFIDDVEQGNAHFRVRYRPLVKDNNRGNFVPRIFDFNFMQNINGEMMISKVFEFIEVKSRDGSVADAKFLDQTEYDQLIEKRRGKEKNDKDLLDRFLGKKK